MGDRRGVGSWGVPPEGSQRDAGAGDAPDPPGPMLPRRTMVPASRQNPIGGMRHLMEEGFPEQRKGARVQEPVVERDLPDEAPALRTDSRAHVTEAATHAAADPDRNPIRQHGIEAIAIEVAKQVDHDLRGTHCGLRPGPPARRTLTRGPGLAPDAPELLERRRPLPDAPDGLPDPGPGSSPPMGEEQGQIIDEGVRCSPIPRMEVEQGTPGRQRPEHRPVPPEPHTPKPGGAAALERPQETIRLRTEGSPGLPLPRLPVLQLPGPYRSRTPVVPSRRKATTS